jgi:hypothetical protein
MKLVIGNKEKVIREAADGPFYFLLFTFYSVSLRFTA